jgi:RHS repeat-associated protein
MNFRLPLMHIGGRGRAGYTMMLPIEQHWRVITVAHPTNCGMNGCTWSPADYQYVANPIWWTGLLPGFSPGVLQGRQGGNNAGYPAEGCSNALYHETLTRLTFTAPDGTEFELRDKLYGGKPLPGGGCFGGPSRGKVFVTADGSAATFVSESEIYDDVQPRTDNVFYPTGYLMLRDGTRYRIVNGQTRWIRDSNGNKVSFSYSGMTLTGIDDQLNRHITITPATSSTPTTISFNGANGIPRTIKIYSANLADLLRKHPDGTPEFTLKTFAQLFSLQNVQQATFNPSLTAAVELPDGRQYQFRYDSYANLSQVILPTGGRFEYDWTTGTALFGQYTYSIYSRVLERRTALDATTTDYETRTVYPFPSSTNSETTVTVDARDPKNGNALLGRSRHYFYGSWLSDPGSQNLYPSWLEGREYQTEVYASDGTTVLRKTNSTFQQRAALPWWTGAPSASPANDPRMVETTTTLMDSGQVVKTSAINPFDSSVGFDQYNNQTDVWQYDFGAATPARHIKTSYLTAGYDTVTSVNNVVDLSSTYHIRDLPTQVSTYEVLDGVEVERARSSFEYDNYLGTECATSNHCQLQPRNDISGFDSNLGTAYLNRGNVTSTTKYRFDNGSVSGSITSYAQYDIAGNVLAAIDNRGGRTTFTYDDCYGTQDGEARQASTVSELSSVNQHSYAVATKMTNALGQVSFAQYDYNLLKPIEIEDPNGVVASAYFNDSLDRPTRLINASNKDVSLKSQTIFEYHDDDRMLTTLKDLNSFNDANPIKTQLLYDGLGRTIEKRQYETPSSYILVQSKYDALGRAYRVSNPSPSADNLLWTTTEFDALGRVISVKTPDNAVVQTFYDGARTLVKDQTGKERISQANAFGQTREIWEITPNDSATESISFPQHVEVTNGYRTKYDYDILDNLISVTQRVGTTGALQVRSFSYNSYKQLISATNPENGTAEYQYDDNGNLIVRTDARTQPGDSTKKVSAHFQYDALNRVIRKWYNGSKSDTATVNNNPTVPSTVGATEETSYYYDSTPLPTSTPGSPTFLRGASIGRLVAVTYGTGSSQGDYYGYDEIGRPILKIQQLGSQNYRATTEYNSAGMVKTESYPSNHTVNSSYDAAGRLNSVTGNLGVGGTQRNYSTEISYSPLGGLAKEKFGTTTPIYNKLFYNIRGQLSEVRVSSSYTGSTDNSWNRGAIVNNYSSLCTAVEGAACSGTDNNGNLVKQNVYIPNDEQLPTLGYSLRSEEFSYDSLNRLAWVSEVMNSNEQWRQEFVYDRFGNRTINTSSNATHDTGTLTKDFNVDVLHNQLQVPANQAPSVMEYDAAGNLINDTYTGNGSRTYDAENRMVSAAGTNGQTQSYVYDGSGQRVKRVTSQSVTWQFYGPSGQLMAEYPVNGNPETPTTEYGYRGGQLLVIASATQGWGEAPSFTGPNPLTAGSQIKLEHLTDLRSAVNELRLHAGLSSFNFTVDPTPERYITTLKADHIRQLRTALDEARSQLGLAPLGYSNSPLVENSSLVYAIDFQELRDQVMSIWQSGAGVKLQWLVTDQLGTPRIILDESGALSKVRRHDYLPFGEELMAGVGGRTGGNNGQGYVGDDRVRQQFTKYEHDLETGLDYARARYYSNISGRFTSADPAMVSAKPSLPQSWNRYAYVLNNPLSFTDPSGMIWVYHSLDSGTVGITWVNGNKVPKDYHALRFPKSGERDITLKDGTSAHLSANSSIAAITGKPQQSSGGGLAPENAAVINQVGRQPLEKAVGACAVIGGFGGVAGGLVLAGSGAMVGGFTSLGLAEAAAADSLLVPVNGIINIGGVVETAEATNVNTLANVANAEAIPNLVVADGSNIGSIFQPGSATQIISSKLPFAALNWETFASGSASVLAAGGRLSMNVTGATPENLAAAVDQLKAAGFQQVAVYGEGWGTIISAIR